VITNDHNDIQVQIQTNIETTKQQAAQFSKHKYTRDSTYGNISTAHTLTYCSDNTDLRPTTTRATQQQQQQLDMSQCVSHAVAALIHKQQQF
jgi:hypothetical protein